MKKLILLAALAAFAAPALPAYAVPMCDGPNFSEVDHGVAPSICAALSSAGSIESK